MLDFSPRRRKFKLCEVSGTEYFTFSEDLYILRAQKEF